MFLPHFSKFLIAFSIIFTSLIGLEAATFQVDKTHTNINFEVAHLVISTVTGRFDDFDGKFKLDDKGNLIELTGTVKTASINTNNAKRDKHLRSADFFNASKKGHEALKFEATDFKIRPGKRKTVTANLTLNNVTKPVKFRIRFKGTAQDPWGTDKAVVEATTEIDRKDFGLNWNEALEAGGVLVGEEVEIELNIQGDKVETTAKK